MKPRKLLGRFVCFSLLWSFAAVAQQPVILDFNPKVGAPGDSVQIIGSGFFGGQVTVRFWNNQAALAFVNSDSIITTTVPSGISTGAISVQKDSGAQFFSSDNFLAIGSGPYISQLSPDIGAVNDSVLILGVHFANTLGVKFNGVPVPSFGLNAAGTQITVFVPPGATNGPVTV